MPTLPRRPPIALVLALALVGPAAQGEPAAPVPRGSAFDLEPGTRVLAPIQFKQLAVFPVVKQAAARPDPTSYLTLADGLANKRVTVSERKEGATVNQVQIANRSDRPLLLLGGEVILGGQQDRVMGKDTVIPPHEQVAVEVFCVEHGRWNGSRNFDRAGGLAEGKIRVRAKFRSNQSEVWDEVAEKTARLKATTATGTYRTLAAGPQGDKAIQSYRDSIGGALAHLPEKDHLVGVVAAINGRVTSVDVFASNQLFASYRDKLLDSIYMTAVDVPVPAAAKPAPEASVIRGFVQRADKAPAQVVVDHNGRKTVQKQAQEVVNSTVQGANAAEEPVYRSYQLNE
jgi:hypothetical protein